MSNSYTRSITDTYTEARARYVIGKVYEDLINLMATGLIGKSFADEIRRDILYLLSKKALLYFELQFRENDNELGGIHYEVKSNSTISMDDNSGNINYWGLYGRSINVSLFIKKDPECTCLRQVNEQLAAWGWGSGSALSGTSEYSKSYSKDGFGVKQSIIGKW